MISARSKITISNLKRVLAEDGRASNDAGLLPASEAEELRSFAEQVRLRKLRALESEKEQSGEALPDQPLPDQPFAEIAENFRAQICDPGTGIYSFPALLFMLEQEYHRAYRNNSALSVIVLKIRIARGQSLTRTRTCLPLPAERMALLRIGKAKRSIDLLGHFGQDRLALVLPQTPKAGAKRLANKLIDRLLQSALVDGLRPTDLEISLGIATAPGDGQNLSILLTRAEAAQVKAEETQTRVGVFAGS